jgi:mRNA-degrading endonuclease RelE of RelBE toxin-antitoxin system
MYDVEFAEDAEDDLARFKANRQREILDKIAEQLSHEPVKETRNKKIIKGLKPPWLGEEPFWELRVGEYRVFYVVDEKRHLVMVRAIRRKPSNKTTKEIL